MAQQPDPAKRRRKSLLLLIPVLLVVAIAVNFGSIIEVARGERTLKGVIYGMSKHSPLEMAGFEVPENVGSEDAKVKLEIYLRGGDPCHVGSAIKGEAVGNMIDLQRMRIVYRDTGTADGLKHFQEVKLGCEQGIAVNGKVKFELPAPDGKGKKRVVYLTGEHAGVHVSAQQSSEPSDEQSELPTDRPETPTPGSGGPKAATAPPDPLADLGAVLDQELKKQYDGKGLGMTPAEFSARLVAEMKAVEDRLAAEAELKAKAKEQEE